MGKRTNTARWTGKMWRIDVQQDGKRKSFYSSRPGRTGQREANAKADAWLDDGIAARAPRVADAGNLWLHEVEVTTCTTNYRPTESRWRNWILPAIGTLRVNKLTDQDLQEVINNAYTAGRSRKVLKLLAADMRAFCKYCRKAKLSAYIPEDLKNNVGQQRVHNVTQTLRHNIRRGGLGQNQRLREQLAGHHAQRRGHKGRQHIQPDNGAEAAVQLG